MDANQRREEPIALPPAAQAAVDAFKEAEVGQQLADPSECGGNCFRASARFRSALREFGSAGLVIEFYAADQTWFHQAVALAGDASDLGPETIVVDWTVRQFAVHSSAPFPEIQRLATLIERWGKFGVITGQNALFSRLSSEDPEAGPWAVAQQRIAASS